MGKHEMKSVPDIVSTDIPTNSGFRHKFEIDAIAVTGDGVVGNGDAVAFPAVDAVADIRLARTVGGYLVVLDDAVGSELGVDSKKGIVKNVVADNDIAGIIYFYAR